MRYNHPTALPRSRAFVSLEWQGARVPVATPGIRGDTYPVAWAADGALYVGTGDPCWTVQDGKIINGYLPNRPDLKMDIHSRISGHVFEKLVGAPHKLTVERINDMPGHTGWGGSGPKPSGMLSVDGTLYYAVQNLLGWKPPRHGVACQHGSDATILQSHDCGKTWTPDLDGRLASYYASHYTLGREHDESWDLPPEERWHIDGWKPMFPGCWFGGPSFVQFGQDNRAAVDGYVYAISGDQWDNGSELRLGRVPKGHIMERGAWEFAIADGKGGVSWTGELYRSQPILAIERHISLPEMVYLPGEGKYLLLTWGLHRDFVAAEGSELTVLEADHPWGPFSLVYYEWMWGKRENCPYCPRVPLKWFDEKTLSGHMLYSGSWENQIPYYMPQTRPFTLIRG